MVFRVFRGSSGQQPGNTEASEAATATAETTDQIGPVLDRLEALAAALESLDGGDHAPAAGPVLETLERMERRDLQAVSAIDTFATALKSVSHHLAHLRQSVHSFNGQHTTKLDALAARLADIEERLGAGLAGGAGVDFAPMAAALDTIVQRLSGLEAKLDSLTTQQAHWPFDADAFATALATIADRLARVEAKVDRVAQQPALEPEATGNLLSAIARRVATVEDKVDSGADGTSIAACLLAVDRRLSRIESGLDMSLPMPTAAEIPDLADVVALENTLEVVNDLVAVPVLPEDRAEAHPHPHPQVQAPEPPHAHNYLQQGPHEELIPPAEEAPAPPPADNQGRDRVDQLLEQVFRVLAR